ncbi:hypothetical protein EVAR_97310_1 [Eumeta japonica]|uniref:Uncharacterized protein n=1 Tax=Eumeta variegata TaxID=151549 RepID=A0A4C1T2M4_EUMVA|nr:hypothetical protein EVAR_97310_1 [Eumeta japonica]
MHERKGEEGGVKGERKIGKGREWAGKGKGRGRGREGERKGRGEAIKDQTILLKLALMRANKNARMSPETVTGRFPFLLPGRERSAAAGWSKGIGR